MTQPPAGPEDRDGSWTGQVRRWAWRYAWHLIFGGTVILAGTGYSLLRGLFAAPGQLAAMLPRLEQVEAQSRSTAEQVQELGEAVWIQTALACLALPRSDSTIAMIRLPCGRAYQRSGITRDVLR